MVYYTVVGPNLVWKNEDQGSEDETTGVIVESRLKHNSYVKVTMTTEDGEDLYSVVKKEGDALFYMKVIDKESPVKAVKKAFTGEKIECPYSGCDKMCAPRGLRRHWSSQHNGYEIPEGLSG